MKIVKSSILALVSFVTLMVPIKTLGGMQNLQKCPECPSGKPMPVKEHFQSHIHEWPLFHCDQIRKMRKRLQELERENNLMKKQITYILGIIGESNADE